MAKFKKGDKVRVTSVNRDNEKDGIYIGCQGVIDEEDTAPYVVFPNARRAMMESQLELVENSTDEEESGWIEWNGGECPVAADVEVEVKFRDGSKGTGVSPWFLNWDRGYCKRDYDIISYRVVDEAEEEFTPGTTTVDVGEPVQEDSGSAATSKHYNSMSVQPIEVWQMVLTPEEFIGALKSQVMKYSIRAGSKAGESSEKDSRKASQYKMWLELAKQGKIIDPRTDVV